MNRRVSLAAALLAASILALAGCGNDAPETVPTELPSATAAPSSPAPTASGGASDSPSAEPACDTIIPGDTVADFEELGWSAKSEPFRAGAVEIDGGISCTWGDYSVATDHVQIYGWAPADEATQDAAVAELVGSGWIREDSEDGIYVTENPEWAIAPDDEGYGITYLFGDGWVTLADTKQSLVLVEWPTS
jgi:hypothetical protein